jgi:hypothetical protein
VAAIQGIVNLKNQNKVLLIFDSKKQIPKCQNFKKETAIFEI